MRSVTTVPMDFANETLSYLLNTPQRVTSPIRGIIRLEAYDRNTAWIQVLLRACSPIGSRLCCHRRPRNNWAVTPKTMENIIYPQSISLYNTSRIRLKSKPRYIHHNIPQPNARDKMTLNVFLIRVLSNEAFILIANLQ